MKKIYRLMYLCGLFLLAGWQANAQTVFINEIHYDNTGTDVYEGVELAGSIGADLADWSIVLYNGGNGLQYKTTDLSGVFAEAGSVGGFNFFWFDIAGIQNGSPDAIALINSSGEVVQFLSYEGTLTAVDGPATGMTSTDIGVSQAGTEPVGESLQLSGDGTAYEDFSWSSSARNTMRAANHNQTFNGIAAPPVEAIEADIATIRTLDQWTLVKLTATLTAVNELGSPAFVQDATGGIAIQDSQIYGSSELKIGDEITLTGTLSSFNGMLQIIEASAISQNGPAATPVVPATIGLSELAAHEGQLVRLEGVSFTTTGNFTGNTNYTLSAGATTATLRVDSDVASLIGMGIPEGTTSVTGLVGSFKGAMQLLPRFAADVPAATPPAPVEADIATIRGMQQGTLVSFTATLTVVDELGGPAFLQDATGGIALFDAQIHANAEMAIGDELTVTGLLGSFNGMLQIVNVSHFTHHGPAATPLVPAVISLSELAAHEGQLVTLEDVDFAAAGVFITSRNYTLAEGTVTGDLRLDNNVTSLEGLAIPQGLSQVTGVIGSFKGSMQLMPRFAEDVPAAAPYEYTHSDVPFASTLDVVSWNMEFFGATQSNFGPNDEALQQANALKVLQELQADIIAVQEISDEAVLQAVVAQLGENYAISCSDKYSYSYNGPDPNFPPQQICFIYNTDVVELLDARVVFDEFYTELRTTGNTELLPDYPAAVGQFWSSGRLPYMIRVRTNINGISEDIRLVNLHAKSGGAAADFARRAYDVQVLKDSLDAQYGTEPLIILGDYNDDLDTSIAEGNDSPYHIFVNSEAYLAPTKVLSDAGYNSYLFNDDMIDHIMVSDELITSYLSESASLYFPFALIDNFANTTSDHLPVRIRMELQRKPQPITAGIQGSLQVYNGYAPEACTTLEALAEGGEGAYSYLWSTGETTASIQVCPTATQSYSVSISDAWGNSGTYEVSVCVSQVDCSNSSDKPKVVVSRQVGTTAFDLCLPTDLVPYVMARGFVLGSANDASCTATAAGGRMAGSYRYVEVENLLVLEGDALHYLPLEAGAVDIKLYDVNGRLVQRVYKGEAAFAEQLSARLQNQPAGMYLLQVSTASGFSKTYKIQR